MAHGDYYNPANKSVTDGTVVYADDVNKINTAVDSALEQVAYDLDVLEADLKAGGLSAKNWATEDQGTRPDPILDLYSAKAYALEAKDWASASGTITEASTGAALAGSASAKTKAAEAANSALAASGSASSAAGSAITATTKAGEALNSANAAALSETNAGNSAISAATSAANLPNATTAGANKLLTTNSSGNGWEYPSITTAGKAILDDASAAEQRATLGLGNVDNTSDINKPISTATQAAINAAVPPGVIVAFLGGYYTGADNAGYTNVLGSTVATANAYLNPKGWYVCNGAEIVVAGSPIFGASGRRLPTLTDTRFIQGNSTSIGLMGGSNSSAHTHGVGHTHTMAHTHGMDHYHTISHVHAVDPPNTATTEVTLSAATIPAHTHTVALGFNASNNLASGSAVKGINASPATTSSSIGSTGAHAHAVNIASFNTGGASPTSSAGASATSTGGVSTGSTGAANITDTGAASATENRPAFLNCLYIMKVK